MVLALILVGQTLLDRNSRKFSGFWRAMDYVAERIEEAPEQDEPPKIACSYHWSVFLREPPGVELIKLPHQLDGWAHLTFEDRFIEVTPSMSEIDWLIVHFALLTELEHASLTHYINEWFSVEAVFWDPTVFEDIGPVLVLKRKPSIQFNPNERTLFDVLKGPSTWGPVSPFDLLNQAVTLRLPGFWRLRNEWVVEMLRLQHGFGEPVRFVRPSLGEELWFLGSTYETLDGDGHGWITYFYSVREPIKADYTFVDRLTSPAELNSWQNNHLPAYGVERTNTWKKGWVVKESWPVVTTADPYRWDEPPKPMGGPFRVGEYMPTYLWFDAVTFYLACRECSEVLFLDPDDPHICGGIERGAGDGEISVSGRLERARFGDDRPERSKPLEERLSDYQGWRWSPDDLTLVDQFLIPIHPWWRMPDDGKPVGNRVDGLPGR